MFETPTEHIVNNLKIAANGEENHYDITFDVILNVVMAEDKSQATINAQERWLLAWDAESNRPTIKEYDVSVIEN